MIGRRLAHYSITDKLGAGGMGEVYRADDTKLGRQVAIKVLPDSMAADPERLARFEREARALAQLNHPNIAAIYGLEVVREPELSKGSDPSSRSARSGSSTNFLVLELVEGETLAERIARGPVPVEEALDLAGQIADALAEAHAAGILHRDLKPANVKVTPDGKVKVLDFGLAKPFLPDPTSDEPSLGHSPTLTVGGATQAGALLGTAAYMSPEQARGQAVDRRTDVWAFGCVLFEMLAGKQAFRGATVSDTLAAVLKDAPPAEALPADLPPAIRRLLRRTLVKAPDQRLRDIADARLELDEARLELEQIPAQSAASEQPPAGRAASAPSRLGFLPWSVAAVAVAAAVWLGLLSLRSEPAPSTQRVVASILPPDGAGFDLDSGGLALSPDGTQLAFTARGDDGRSRLWVRPIGRGTARMLNGTVGASMPFWSPDGQQLGFGAEGKIKKIRLEGELVETLADAPEPSGGAWNADGDILFVPVSESSILRVPAFGGAAEPVTEAPAQGEDFNWPAFLPDGRHFLFSVRRYASDEMTGQIRIGSLDGDPSRPLFDANSNASYAPPGYVVWWHDGNLRARPFDAGKQEFSGDPIPLVSNARFDPRQASAAFSLSRTGVLVYQQGGAVSGNQLVWVDREGNELGAIGPAGSLYTPRLSPDGSRIALDISGETNQGDIWLLDVKRGTGSRLTMIPEDESSPIWSPDGEALLYFSMQGGTRAALFRRQVDGSDDAQLAARHPEVGLAPLSWSRDGHALVITDRSQAFREILVYSLDDQELRPFLSGEFNVNNGSFSSDGRYVVYQTDETGRREVYITTFPSPDRRWIVSTEGGEWPMWNSDGSEIFYVSPRTEEMMVVTVQRGDGAELSIGSPRALFRIDAKEHDARQYDTVDGQRFLINRNVRAGARDPLTLVLNWPESLAR